MSSRHPAAFWQPLSCSLLTSQASLVLAAHAGKVLAQGMAAAAWTKPVQVASLHSSHCSQVCRATTQFTLEQPSPALPPPIVNRS